MQWSYRTIDTANGVRRLVVAAPEQDEMLGAGTLELLRANKPAGYDHAELVSRVRAEPEPVHGVVLRARGADGSGQFRMGRDLDDAQLVEIGFLLAKAQLEAWRPVLDEGLLCVARVELRVWELAALRSGTAKLAAELETRALASDPKQSAVAKREAWVLEHAMLNFGVGLDTALADLMPSRMQELDASANRRP